MFGSIPGLDLLDANSSPPLNCDKQKYLQELPVFLEVHIAPSECFLFLTSEEAEVKVVTISEIRDKTNSLDHLINPHL